MRQLVSRHAIAPLPGDATSPDQRINKKKKTRDGGCVRVARAATSSAELDTNKRSYLLLLNYIVTIAKKKD